MSTVTLDSEFTVYANVEEADAYLDGASHASAWRDIDDDDDKARYLITATRILDRQRWKDEYNTFALRAAVPNIVNASIELALYLVGAPEVQDQQTTAERVRRIQAGSVSIENFRGVDLVPMRFPLIVQELLRDYLASGATTLYGRAVGVDTETSFPADLGFTGGL